MKKLNSISWQLKQSWMLRGEKRQKIRNKKLETTLSHTGLTPKFTFSPDWSVSSPLGAHAEGEWGSAVSP